jgi:hypothetical protein
MPLNDRDRKALKLGGIVAAVLVLALLLVGQLGKGGAPALPPLSVGPSSSGGPTGGPTVGPSGSATPSGGGPTPSPIFAGRDPFSLPPQFVTASPSGTGGPTGPTGSPSGTGGPTGPTGPTGTGSPTSSPSNGASTVVGGHTVVLIDTYTVNGVQHATVSVDGTVYHPAVGATFAGGNFQLRDVAGHCATFLFGDQSFTLCFVSSK